MKRDSLFYMANLGSEMIRVFNAYEKKDLDSLKSSAYRAKSIINKIMLEPDMEKRKEEIIIFNDIIEDMIINIGERRKYNILKEHIESYFSMIALRLQSR